MLELVRRPIRASDGDFMAAIEDLFGSEDDAPRVPKPVAASAAHVAPQHEWQMNGRYRIG